MQAKTIFLKDKDLRDWLAAIVKHDNWQRCLAHARSEMMESGQSLERLMGFKDFENILYTMPDPDEGAQGMYPTSGLHHDLDAVLRSSKAKVQPKK
jgi:hypothetical protein